MTTTTPAIARQYGKTALAADDQRLASELRERGWTVTPPPPGWVEFTRPAQPDAAGVFAALVREVDAGRALVAMTPPGERHRAAVDALALARDVLADARDLFGSCACGRVDLAGADLGGAHVVDGIAHAPAACVQLDETTGEQL